jgi:MFS family permease
LLANVVGGISWAAVEYASYQLLLQSAEPELRIEFLSAAGALSGLLQVCGGLAGGRLLDVLGATYVEIFWLSAIARAVPLALFLTLPKKAWPTELPRLFMRIISVRPAAGVLRRPIVGRESSPSNEKP